MAVFYRQMFDKIASFSYSFESVWFKIFEI